jgi:2-polyprenyl-3-methyl-5-hydroxy-6-metoxy-1,4-benzoquinol methylase
MSEKQFTCEICQHSGNFPVYKVKEMMFGTAETFTYAECPSCKTLFLADPPENMGDYYPKNYYSFGKLDAEKYYQFSLSNLAKISLFRYRLGKSSFLGAYLADRNFDYFPWLDPEFMNFDSRILDVGCGNGHLLLNFARAGFKSLKGIDPFIPGDIEYERGIKIYKKGLFEFGGKFDLVMLNHSYEHMQEPEKVMKKLASLLDYGGTLLIRIPVAESTAWEIYREFWAQIDAPRHYFIHSVGGMKILAERTGLLIEKIFYDSDEFQFRGSELYKKGLPLYEGENAFSKKQIKEWRKQARELNRTGKADMACFFLRKHHRPQSTESNQSQ